MEKVIRFSSFGKWIIVSKEVCIIIPEDNLIISSSKTYLNVPFSQKDEAKSLGARWEPNQKKWYVPSGKDIRIFSSWLLA